jgi:hypothetical protein
MTYIPRSTCPSRVSEPAGLSHIQLSFIGRSAIPLALSTWLGLTSCVVLFQHGDDPVPKRRVGDELGRQNWERWSSRAASATALERPLEVILRQTMVGFNRNGFSTFAYRSDCSQSYGQEMGRGRLCCNRDQFGLTVKLRTLRGIAWTAFRPPGRM